MADVFKAMPAEADEYSRPVVIRRIKKHLASNPVFMDQLVETSRTAAALSHPNIVQVHNFGYFRDAFYMVQEYVSGTHLGVLLDFFASRQSSLDPAVCAYVGINLCRALEFAHGHWGTDGRPSPVLHRNITRQNVLLSIDGAVKLGDFGLSMPPGAVSTTASALDVEKYVYMSPELACGRPVDERSDLYSLGLVVYEMLSGRRAFEGVHPSQLLEKIREAMVMPLELVSSKAPPALMDLVGRLLTKDRDQRPANAREVRMRLEAYLRGVMRPVDPPIFGELVCDVMDAIASDEEGGGDDEDELTTDDLDEPSATIRELQTSRGSNLSVTQETATHSDQTSSDQAELPRQTETDFTATATATRTRRREVRIPCQQWESFVSIYKDSISQRGISVTVSDPPRPGSLLNMIFELPNGDQVKIPGEVYRVENLADGQNRGLVSVVMELSDPTETKVRDALGMAEKVLGPGTSADALVAPATETRESQSWRVEPVRKRVSVTRSTLILGVDFGTTYSSAAVIDDGSVVTIADPQGHVAIPSIVWFRGRNDFVIGQEAFEHMARDPASTVASSKRLLGRRFDDQEISPLLGSYACPVYAGSSGSIKFEVANQVARPHEIAAIILRYVKQLAEEQLGRPVDKAVLAYPVMFDEAQVGFLQKAARMAGLKVAALIPEPVAVAIGHNPTGEGVSVLGVFDLGGGSTSFSILSIAGGHHQVVGYAADPWCGGEELTRALASGVAQEFQRTAGIDIRRNAFDYQRVLQRCEKAKWSLSFGDEVAIRIDRVSAPGRRPVKLDVTIRPDQFRQLTKDFVERTLAVCLRGLKAARVSRGDLTEVLLTGAMRRLPDVQPAVRDLFGFNPQMATVPELSVAIGTAVQGAKLEGLTVMPRRAPAFTQTPSQDLIASSENSWVVNDEAPPIEPEPGPAPAFDARSAPALVEESFSSWAEPEEEPQHELAGVAEHAGVGTRLGRYELLAEIGAGGMASIFLSKISGPAGFQKPVALKVIHAHLSTNKYFLNLFLDEARLASQLQHPNIVQIFELGEDDGLYYIAMECLTGETVVSLNRRLVDPVTGLLDPRVACHIAIQAAEGLHYAHEMTDLDGHPLELVHRDVSPQNIFVTYAGGIKLLDFGVAKAQGRSQETPTGELKGKWAYMSPEQIRENIVDRRCDVFALGINLWEMLTGKRLFMSKETHSILTKICHGRVPPVSRLRPDVPAAIDRVVLKALEKDPAARYQTAMEFQEDLLDATRDIGGPILPPSLAAAMDVAFAEEKRQWQEFMSASLSGRPPTAPFRKAGAQPSFEEGLARIPDEDGDDDPYSRPSDHGRTRPSRDTPPPLPGHASKPPPARPSAQPPRPSTQPPPAPRAVPKTLPPRNEGWPPEAAAGPEAQPGPFEPGPGAWAPQPQPFAQPAPAAQAGPYGQPPPHQPYGQPPPAAQPQRSQKTQPFVQTVSYGQQPYGQAQPPPQPDAQAVWHPHPVAPEPQRRFGAIHLAVVGVSALLIGLVGILLTLLWCVPPQAGP